MRATILVKNSKKGVFFTIIYLMNINKKKLHTQKQLRVGTEIL